MGVFLSQVFKALKTRLNGFVLEQSVFEKNIWELFSIV